MGATAFLFPGQGSQEVGMLQELCQQYEVARATFAEADDLLGVNLSELCWQGPEEQLTDTINAQPALLTAGVAVLRVLQQELGDPIKQNAASGATFVAGHSMGEYTALVAAGCLTFAHGLRLVRERGRLMKQAGVQQPGMMAAILGLDEAKVATICAEASAQGGIAQVANDNCPGQVVISGDKAGMEAAMSALSAAGAKRVMPLAVSIAAHSPLMQPAAEELRAAIQATPLAPPVAPIIGNTTAHPLTTVAAIQDELTAQLTGSVRWTTSMQTALAAGVKSFVELGPGEVLTGLIKRIDRSAERWSLNAAASVQAYVQKFR
ncbi:MAG: [acyl-carrier-protein] S-malonyltransferase [Caldilinea sp. CFX5]|nr:[acyl-carrier-protein] S-malonyltransferase [Caldilinea sp. CFX5]